MTVAPLELDVLATPADLRLAVAGEVDMQSAPRLRDLLGAQLDDGRPVRVDLSRVTFMDSVGLLVLWQAAAEAGMRGRSLAIDPDLPRCVRRIMEVTQLLRLLPVG
jgi:anti-anti-sigma factor